jgi:putative hydrolase of HD superfamily
MDRDRLEQQIGFIVEIDKLKHILRQSLLLADERQENDAEHSWHLATMAILLSEYAADPKVDLLRVVKMLLVHDLVEIDAGDTFAYDADGHRDKVLREETAAERLFNLLPADQAGEVRQLWDEFEARETPAARYAGALDRLQPVLLNLFSGGGGWRRHGITKQQVIDYNQHIAEGAPDLWDWVREKIEEAVADGVLRE